jgi:hypothetical protein
MFGNALTSQTDFWYKEKRVVFEKASYDFLDICYINSKDHVGLICLGKNLYEGQRKLITEIFDGLENGVHEFYILKARQLGISTIIRALGLFWNGVHAGLSGAVVFDTDVNKITARREIEAMLENLPSWYDFPRPSRGAGTTNRTEIILGNRSRIQLLSAGVKKSKASGVLGRSSGLSFAHCSEMCSWDNEEGVVSFRESLSDLNPNRLFIWESTARGFNQWHEMWSEARADPTNKKCIFLGWWSKESQQISKGTADFSRYGIAPPTDHELKKIAEVKKLYGHEVSPEQLAWVRKKMNPATIDGDSAEADSETENVTKLQEQPWTEEDAFQMTGTTFFPPEALQDQTNKFGSKKFKAYSYAAGSEFTDFRVYPAHNSKSTELKVWEEPVEQSVYVIAADVAFGHSDRNDRSAIQVMRAYSDSLEQVAEYAWPLISSKQFAWVIASLLGWYGGKTSECYLILEMNGPGEATWNELQSLKNLLAYNYFPDADKKGLQDIFRNARNYIYTRSDSMSSGHSYQWVTNTRLKITIFERLRDFTINGTAKIRSFDTLEEMRSITRNGDSVEAQGSKKDDRVFAAALSVRCWEERARKRMISEGRTMAFEAQRRRLNITDQLALFNQNQLSDMFKIKQFQRQKTYVNQMNSKWRRGR